MAGGTTFVLIRLRHRGDLLLHGEVDTVEPGDRQIARHGQPAISSALHHSQR